MGFAIIDSQSKYAGAWSRWDNPPRPLAAGESAVECDWDAENNRPVGVAMPDPPLEQVRSEKVAQLHQWWDTHRGIEVADGIVLPIQEAGRNTNSSSLTLGLLTQSQTISLVSVDDYTVTIDAADAITALGIFRAAYDPISATWDETHQALVAATTREELEAVEMPQ
jgi:hypothetical protein